MVFGFTFSLKCFKCIQKSGIKWGLLLKHVLTPEFLQDIEMTRIESRTVTLLIVTGIKILESIGAEYWLCTLSYMQFHAAPLLRIIIVVGFLEIVMILELRFSW
jgi:hypothetical protein